MKKIMMAILSMVLLALSFNVSAQTQTGLEPWTGDTASAFAGGSGTEADPYLITSGSHLALMHKNYNVRTAQGPVEYYRLENDIDLGGALPENERPNYKAIGTNAGTKGFNGVFDGNNHKIYNVYQNAPTEKLGGLFGALVVKVVDGALVGGMVKNLTLMSGLVTGQTVGGIVGNNKGTVENCHNYANVEGGTEAGGICGRSEGTYDSPNKKGLPSIVKNCKNYGEVKCSAVAGGIIGVNSGQGSRTFGCINYGMVQGNTGGAGGVVGNGSGTKYGSAFVEQCVNLGTVTIWSDIARPIVGGLVGRLGKYGVLSNCAQLGKIVLNETATNLTNTSCIAGYAEATATDTVIIKNCISAGTVYVPGSISIVTYPNSTTLAPYNEKIQIQNIYNDMQQTGQTVISLQAALTGGTCLPTKDMVAGTALEGFNPEIWSFKAGAYPMLKIFEADARVQLASYAPVFSYTDETTYDKFNAIRQNFTLPTASGLQWTLTKGTTAVIEGNTVKVTRLSDKSDTLVLQASLNGQTHDYTLVVLMQSVDYTIAAAENGAVKVFEGETELPATGKVEENMVLRLEAAPAEGYLLDYYTINGEKWYEPTFTVKGATEISAVFMKDEAPEPWDGSIATAFGGGTGSKTAPFQIRTPAELAYLAQEVNKGTPYVGKHFVVVFDLDLNRHEWTPIGLYREGGNSVAFEGSFDGRKKTISNMYMSEDGTVETGGYGLFGYVNGYDSIWDVTIDGSIHIVDAKAYVGMLVAYSGGKDIRHCTAKGRISGEAGFAGGIVGRAGVHVKGNVNYVNINVKAQYAGGLAGFSLNGRLADCANLADSVICIDGVAGGVLGAGNAGRIESCYNAGVVIGGQNAGGIAGTSSSGAVGSSGIAGCYNTGLVSAQNAGGIVGLSTGSIHQSFNAGKIEGEDYAGGLVPVYNGATISECYNIGEISVSGSTGLAGEFMGRLIGGTLSHVYFDKQIRPDALGIGSQAGSGSYGLLTAQLVDALPDGFDARYWVSEKGHYPHLKDLPVVDALYLQSAALKLYALDESIYDTPKKMRNDAEVCAGEGLAWQVVSGTALRLEENILKVMPTEEVDMVEVKATYKTHAKTYRLAVHPLRYILTLNQTAGGTIAAANEAGETVASGAELAPGTTVVLSYTAAEGYEFVQWFDGDKAATKRVTMDVDKTVSAVFAKQTFVITASAGEGGSIAPAGETTVAYGDNQMYTFLPDGGYELAALSVDGEAVEVTGNSYTFTDVRANHSIRVTFKPVTFTVSATCGQHGRITPAGDSAVAYGQDITYTITADEGYKIDKMVIDGIAAEPAGTYTFSRVIAPHTIHVEFAPGVANEGLELAGVSVYPNPSEGEFTLNLPVAATVEVFASTGVLRQRIEAGAGIVTLNIERSGIYFLRITGEGRTTVKRIVVR